MFSSIGLRAWSVILSLVILAIGLTAVTGFMRMARRNAELVDAYHDVEVYSLRLQVGVERLMASDSMSDSAEQRISDFLSELEKRAMIAEVDSEVRLVAERWGDFRSASSASRAALAAPLRQSMNSLRDAAVARFSDARKQVNVNFRNWSVAGALLTFIGLLLTLVFFHSTSEVVITPLDHVTRIIDRVNAGDTSLRIPDESVGSVRRLARSCNRLLEHLEKLLDEGRSQVNRRQRQALALIEAFDQPVVMADGSGVVILANSEARELLTGMNKESLENAIEQAVKEDIDIECQACKVTHLDPRGDSVRNVLALSLAPSAQEGKDAG